MPDRLKYKRTRDGTETLDAEGKNAIQAAVKVLAPQRKFINWPWPKSIVLFVIKILGWLSCSICDNTEQ